MTRRSRPTASLRVPIRIQPSPGLIRSQEEALDRQLAEFLAARELKAEGTQLRMWIHADDRELGPQDMADLVCWFMDQPTVGAIQLQMVNVNATKDALSWVTASRSDRAVEPLIQLYRLGRIPAVTFFDALASFQPRNSARGADD